MKTHYGTMLYHSSNFIFLLAKIFMVFDDGSNKTGSTSVPSFVDVGYKMLLASKCLLLILLV